MLLFLLFCFYTIIIFDILFTYIPFLSIFISWQTLLFLFFLILPFLCIIFWIRKPSRFSQFYKNNYSRLWPWGD
jgi:hypothetical protein